MLNKLIKLPSYVKLNSTIIMFCNQFYTKIMSETIRESEKKMKEKEKERERERENNWKTKSYLSMKITDRTRYNYFAIGVL